MSFKTQSPDAQVPSAGRDAPQASDATYFLWPMELGRSARPTPEEHAPDAGSTQPPEGYPVWRWIRKAASWLLTFFIEGFAAYGNAMYPAFDLSEPLGPPTTKPTGDAPLHNRHVDGINAGSCVSKDALTDRPEVFVRNAIGLKMVPHRRTCSTVGLSRLAERWRRKVSVSQHVAPLWAFSDPVLLDLGIVDNESDTVTSHACSHHDHDHA